MPSDWMVTEGDEDVLKLICPGNLNSVREDEVVVWVDPLDGTSEYTQGKATVKKALSLACTYASYFYVPT